MKEVLTRAANRAKRQAIARIAPVNRIVVNAHESRVRDYRPHLPAISPTEAVLVKEVDANGVAITSLDELALPGTSELKAALTRLTDKLAAREPGASSAIKPSREELAEETGIYQWGLNNRLLDVVENYLGLPARYYGAAVYREVADGKTEGTRQWHRDIEDFRVFKILVWLNDVGPRGGAFQYVPRPVSDPAVTQLKYVAGFVTDPALSEFVDPTQWVKATGPQWTAVMADPARILHRASPAEDRDRYSVTFTWTSRNPIKTIPNNDAFTNDEMARLRQGLDSRQIACLPES